MLGGWVVLFAGGLATGEPVEPRFLACDSITTSSLCSAEECVVGVVDGLLGRLALVLAAGLLALPAALSRVGCAVSLHSLLELVCGAPVTELRADQRSDADSKTDHDHCGGDSLQPGGTR